MVWTPPAVCPQGHPLLPPGMKRAWEQCDCPHATGRPSGHDYVMCGVCGREIREGGCDELVDGYPR